MFQAISLLLNKQNKTNTNYTESKDDTRIMNITCGLPDLLRFITVCVCVYIYNVHWYM